MFCVWTHLLLERYSLKVQQYSHATTYSSSSVEECLLFGAMRPLPLPAASKRTFPLDVPRVQQLVSPHHTCEVGIRVTAETRHYTLRRSLEGARHLYSSKQQQAKRTAGVPLGGPCAHKSLCHTTAVSPFQSDCCTASVWSPHWCNSNTYTKYNSYDAAFLADVRRQRLPARPLLLELTRGYTAVYSEDLYRVHF